jgi:hypothetical protein
VIYRAEYPEIRELPKNPFILKTISNGPEFVRKVTKVLEGTSISRHKKNSKKKKAVRRSPAFRK